MDDAAADTYHHGDQNISEQIHTYRAFDDLSKYGALSVAVLVLMLTLWFCLGIGFLGGLIPGIIVLALGAWFLRRKPAQHN
jgi:thiamine transporter ThiT